MGLLQWDRFVVEAIPIPRISGAKQRPFIELVDTILEKKDANPDADVSELKPESMSSCMNLYGLTEDEIAAVDRARVRILPYPAPRRQNVGLCPKATRRNQTCCANTNRPSD